MENMNIYPIEASKDMLEAENKTLKEQNEDLNIKLIIYRESEADHEQTIESLNAQISILEENITRSNTDRLAELTSIMRLIQALDRVPIQKYGGAISLIKSVLYQEICKLDPSQSWE
jgi:septal ring factor EnvC (AmiA/AmiB activator)